MTVIDRKASELVSGLRDGTDPGYGHIQKRASPSEPFVAESMVLKWYDLSFSDREIPRERQQAARRFLETQVELLTEDADQTGFVFLHDCRSVVFLFAGLWRHNNELWGKIYLQLEGESGFDTYSSGDGPNPIFCVWEMAIVWHESMARTRYLLSERSAVDRIAWLADMFEGLTPDL
jgi:hypothetical protein